MSPIQYRTHSKAIQYLILSKFWGALQARRPLIFLFVFISIKDPVGVIAVFQPDQLGK